VASFLEAQVRQGQWLLRIDDLDTPRNVAGAADEILRTLEVFGLHWDESIFYQSQHQQDYHIFIEKLWQQHVIYRCVCSRKDLLNYQSIYPQFCRHKIISTRKNYALRVKTTTHTIQFQDQLQGCINHNVGVEEGDFIIRRKDNIVAYQLAVVIDDELQHVNHVIRGLDLLDSTPRQLYLQQLLKLNSPRYLHIPIIIDKAGHKLSKQTLARGVDRTRPEKTLYFVLQLLKQQPPMELKKASVRNILDWAIVHWEIKSLKSIKEIATYQS
jgi:glutamyl-Q tRNA(Asp) synthetase